MKYSILLLGLLSIIFTGCEKDCREDFRELAWYQDNKGILISADSSIYSVGAGDKRVFVFERKSSNCYGEDEIVEAFFFERPVTEQGFSCMLDLSECRIFYQQKQDGKYSRIKQVRSGRVQAARQLSPEENVFRGSFGFKVPEPLKVVFDKEHYPNDVFVQPAFRLKP